PPRAPPSFPTRRSSDLAGLTQVFRITGDPKIREIIDLTVNLFDRYFKDTTNFPDGTPRRGYYSHIDPVTFDPLSPALDEDGRTNGTARTGTRAATTLPRTSSTCCWRPARTATRRRWRT